jgi:hypothetical protein
MNNKNIAASESSCTDKKKIEKSEIIQQIKVNST